MRLGSLLLIASALLVAVSLGPAHATCGVFGSESDPNCWWDKSFRVNRRVGEGYRAEAYLGVRRSDNVTCVIKVFKQGRSKRTESIQREVDAMMVLRGAPNILQLIDVMKEPNDEGAALVYEFGRSTDLDLLFPKLSDLEVRYYALQLLRALAYAHSKGLMHLDIKPSNVLIDHQKHELHLIDWGRARIYTPGGPLIRSSNGLTTYLSPEQLLGMGCDLAADVWNMGQLIGGMIVNRNTKALIDHHGQSGKIRLEDEDCTISMDSNFIQIKMIAKILGTEEVYTFLERRQINLRVLNPFVYSMIGKREKTPFSKFVNRHNQAVANPEALDLLNGLLRADPRDRLTAQQATEHRYFDPVRRWTEWQGPAPTGG